MTRARNRPVGFIIQYSTQTNIAKEAFTQRIPSEFEKMKANTEGEPLPEVHKASVRRRMDTRRPKGRLKRSRGRGGRGGKGGTGRKNDRIMFADNDRNEDEYTQINEKTFDVFQT